MVKKTTVIEEDVKEEPKEDFKYEDVHDKTTEDIVETKEGYKAPVEKAPEPKVEPKEKEIEFDPAKFKEEVSKEATDKIVKALTGEGEVRKDSVDRELVSPWKKENRNPRDYDEIAEWAVQKKEILDRKSAVEKAKQTEEQKRSAEQNEKTRLESFNKYVDAQLDDLYKNGKLITPKDPKNENDIGVIQRKALFKAMLDVNTERTKQGLDPIYSIKEIYYEHYKDPTKQPAGYDAPVSMGRSASAHDDTSGEYDYREIHKKPWYDFFRK